MIKNQKILFVSAHFGDLELGCGGTLAKLNKKNKVYIVNICNSEFHDNNKKIIRDKKTAYLEGLKALKILGIKKNNIHNLDINTFEILKNEKKISKKLIEYNLKYNFDIVFTHWEKDVHPDHFNTYRICKSVFKRTKSIIQFTSNYYTEEFKPNIFINISKEYKFKKKAIEAHKSEMIRTKNKWKKYFLNKNSLDAIRYNIKFVETFYSNRIFLDE